MKRLIKTKKMIYMLIILILSSTIIFSIISSQIKIERFFKTTVTIDVKDQGIRLQLNSNQAYLVNNKSFISLKIGDDNYKISVAQKFYDPNTNKFYAVLNDNQIPFIPKSTIPVTVIYDKETLLSRIIGVV